MTLKDIFLALPGLIILAYIIFFAVTRRPLFKEYREQKRTDNIELKNKGGNQ